MRARGGPAHGAAVDTMGCERLADRTASARDQRFHTLISLMLSSQTKDTVNAVAMQRLKTELPAHEPGAPVGLNLDNVLAVDAGVLNGLIRAVGFHNNKTRLVFFFIALVSTVQVCTWFLSYKIHYEAWTETRAAGDFYYYYFYTPGRQTQSKGGPKANQS